MTQGIWTSCSIVKDSNLSTLGEFCRHRHLMSSLLLTVLGLAILMLWPLLVMPVLVQ